MLEQVRDSTLSLFAKMRTLIEPLPRFFIERLDAEKMVLARVGFSNRDTSW